MPAANRNILDNAANVVLRTISLGARFLLILILARALGPSEFGLFTLVQTTDYELSGAGAELIRLTFCPAVPQEGSSWPCRWPMSLASRHSTTPAAMLSATNTCMSRHACAPRSSMARGPVSRVPGARSSCCCRGMTLTKRRGLAWTCAAAPRRCRSAILRRSWPTTSPSAPRARIPGCRRNP